MIRLRSGRIIGDRAGITIDDGGNVEQAYDTTTSLGTAFETDTDITADTLTPAERAELAAIMVERWTSFGGGDAVVALAMEERRAFEAAEEAEMERREMEHAEHRAARVEHVNRPARGTGGDAVMAMDRKTLEAKRAARFAARKRKP